MQALTVVIPVYNEEACLDGLLAEVRQALAKYPEPVEVLVVDDGSDDRTAAILERWLSSWPQLRVLTFAANTGQSAAMAAGFRAARHPWVVAMDGDGQSDPADIQKLAAKLEDSPVVCGYRARRKDTWSKRWGSQLANAVRRSVTGDRVIDIGCSLKGFHREPLQLIPYFEGSHRFLPVLLGLQGCTMTQVEVHHRSRSAGVSKYSNWGRLKRTWADLLGVRWLQNRPIPYRVHHDSLAPGESLPGQARALTQRS